MIALNELAETLRKEEVIQKRLDKFNLAIYKSKKRKNDIAVEMKISVSYLSNMLSGRGELIPKHRKKLNQILNTNY